MATGAEGVCACRPDTYNIARRVAGRVVCISGHPTSGAGRAGRAGRASRAGKAGRAGSAGKAGRDHLMTEFANPQLSAWESFYVIVGSSAGALIGLQFV